MKAFKFLIMATLLASPNVMADNHEGGKHEMKIGYRAALHMDQDDQEGWTEATEFENTGMSFKSDFARIQFSGDINDKLSYKVRYRLDKSASKNDRETLNDNVDYAMFAHKMGNGKLMFGKQAIKLCATEKLWSALDLYTKSAACYAALSYEYNTGVSYEHKISNGKVRFYLGNGHDEKTTNAKETATSIALAYYGKFGAFQPVFTYASFARPEVAGGSIDAHSDTSTSLGLRYHAGKILAELDYSMFTNDTGTSADAETITSMLVHVRYNMGKWTPFLKIESSSGDEDTTDVSSSFTNFDTKQGMLLGAEYKPWDKADFSYFFLVKQDTYGDDTTGGSEDYKDNAIQFGVKGSLSKMF